MRRLATGKKPVRSMLVKVTTVSVNFINILFAPFCTKELFAAFLKLQFGFAIFLAREYRRKSSLLNVGESDYS